MDAFDSGKPSDEAKKANVVEAIFMLHTAWQRVTPPTIANCFRHAKFHDESSGQTESLANLNVPNDNEDGLLAMTEAWDSFADQTGGKEYYSLPEYLDIDKGIATEGPEALDIAQHSNTADNSESDSEDDSEVPAAKPPTRSEVAVSL